MRIADLIQQGISDLQQAGVPDCVSDVYLLLGHCLQRSRTQLLAAARDEVGEEVCRKFLELMARRKKREPVAYILGEQEFWSRSFLVNRHVLIPRPETEFMLEMVLRQNRSMPFTDSGAVLDLCCGSGVIAIILALELHRQVFAIDISADALNVTRQNSRRHGVDGQVHLMQGDLLSGILPAPRLALVVSNPPYVTTRAVNQEVEPEVGEHEPALALDGGPEGLDLIGRIRRELPERLVPGGQVFMEIGFDQGEAVHRLFSTRIPGLRDFYSVEILQDYAGHDRVLHAIIS